MSEKDEPGVVDTRTGKILVTRKELFEGVKKYLAGKTDDELRAIMKIDKPGRDTV